MRLIKITIILLLGVFLASCSKNPDVIYINGKIYTLDKNNSIVEAVAVREGKILAVGKSKDLTEKYSSVQVIDLGGKTVVPGFIDAEGNLMEFSRNLDFVDLRNAENLNEIVQIVTEKIKASKEGEWIGGFGWDDLELPEEDFQNLDKSVLDNISTKHYIYLVNSRADMVWVNSKVLEAAKITKDTPNPENGEIEKDDSNEPTGILYDDAQELVMKVLPQPTEAQVMANVERGIKELYKY
jgi:predicted amidohydrolase YtcJ